MPINFNVLDKLNIGSRFIPLNGNKQPLDCDWQNSGYSLSELQQKFKWFKAVGILTGNGLIAIDVDGLSAYAKAQELSGLADPFPHTVKFTSRPRTSEAIDQPEKFQALYKVPCDWNLKNKPINCPTADGRSEQLDFRLNGRQSVIAGEHPDTGAYRFVEGCSPDLVDIADCPLWVKDYFDSLEKEASETYESVRQNYTITSNDSIPLEILLSKENQGNLNGLPKGSRFSGLQSLAGDLIGCERYCLVNGINYHGTAYDLFTHARIASGSNDRKSEAIFKGFEGKDCKPHVSEETLLNRIHWYRWEHYPEYKAAAKAEYRKQFINNDVNTNVNNSDSGIDSYIDSASYEAYLQWEQEQERVLLAMENERLSTKATTFIEDLKTAAHNLSKKWFKGFDISREDVAKLPVPELPEKIEYDPEKALPKPADYEGKQAPLIVIDHLKYPVERLILELKKAGWEDIIDQSPTGSGKSHTIGNLRPEIGEKYIYIDVNHNNPSTQQIKDNYSNLWSKHDGYKLENGKLKRSTQTNEKLEVSSNCRWTHIFNELGEKNTDYQLREEGAPNPICNACPDHYRCPTSRGDGYGYLGERRNALASPLIRADIRSLPSPNGFPYGDCTAFIEEGTSAIAATNQVIVDIRDFDNIFADLKSKNPTLYKQLEDLNISLRCIFSEEKPPRYGYNKETILKMLTIPSNLEGLILELEKMQPDLSFEKGESIKINDEEKKLKETNPREYEKKKRLHQITRNHLRKDAREHYLKKLNDLSTNFLIPLLQVLKKDAKGAIRFNFGELTITLPNQRSINTLNAFKTRIYLDATPNIEKLALVRNVDPKTFLSFTRKVEPPKNLFIFPINIVGIKSRNWSNVAMDRVKAISEALNILPDLVELGYKKHKQELDLDGWWGNHTRGTNEFIGKEAIALYGLPTPNIGQVEDEYLCLNGTLDGFEQYYKKLVEVEVIQALGRQRAALNPDLCHSLYLVACFDDFDLSFLSDLGYQVDAIREGIELTPAAGTKTQNKKSLLIEGILEAYGQARFTLASTQTELAKLLNIPQQTISRLLQNFQGGIKGLKNLLISLYESIYSQMGKISLADLIQKSQELREWLEIPPAVLTEEIFKLVEDGTDSEKLEKIKTHILGHPQPLLIIGHILGLIKGMTAADSA